MRSRPKPARGVRIIVASLLLSLLPFNGCRTVADTDYQPQEGDVLFQSLPHGQLVDAIEGVSQSNFSHCGLAAKQGEKWVVIEAIEPVKETPLNRWISQGRDRRFSAYRLKPAYAPHIPGIVAAARSHLGAPYDCRYQFDDQYIYCSELVFKAFRQATGEDLGQVRKLGDLNWQPFESFIRSMENGNLPLDREMITPVDLSKADQLVMVHGELLATVKPAHGP